MIKYVSQCKREVCEPYHYSEDSFGKFIHRLCEIENIKPDIILYWIKKRSKALNCVLSATFLTEYGNLTSGRRNFSAGYNKNHIFSKA